MKRIIRNSVKCHKCDTEVESKHVHHFISCKCGNIIADGGKEYLRRIGSALSDNSYTDTSIEEDVVKKNTSEIIADIGKRLKEKQG
jgi:cytochrome b involved in lipid metabolism